MRQTDNSIAYRFDDFTHASYERLLVLARRQYAFRRFDDFDRGEIFVLWRHDLDFAVLDALPLARMEADAGVAATYFVHLHSSFYSPFDEKNLRAVREIAALGHAIGLHFDFEAAAVRDEADLQAKVAQEAAMMEAQYGVPARALSFHNPTPASLAYDGERYAGLVNTYAAYFRQQVAYCSDSNGHWRFDRLEDVLLRPATRPLQVLTHPTWWTKEVMSPSEKVRQAIASNAAALVQEYSAILAHHGRKDIDW
jgi:hypothetical protein